MVLALNKRMLKTLVYDIPLHLSDFVSEPHGAMWQVCGNTKLLSCTLESVRSRILFSGQRFSDNVWFQTAGTSYCVRSTVAEGPSSGEDMQIVLMLLFTSAIPCPYIR